MEDTVRPFLTEDVFDRKVANHVVVVAMDFGTTFSGYSFSYVSSPADVFTPNDWGESTGIGSSCKTPTCVLTDDHDNYVAMGYNAMQKYSLMTPEEISKHRFYDRFKMKLHNVEKLDKNTPIEDQLGHKTSALIIFSMVLEGLKDAVFAMMHKQKAGDLDKDLIRWVVTVPAIWSDSAKQFMKEAAMKAGLVRATDSNNLMIALEPEAASVWCRQLPVHDFTVASGQSTKLAAGYQYLVLDAGGGTLDITAHKVLDDNSLEELHCANGGPMGAAKITDNFLKLLDDIFEKKFLDQYKAECPSDFRSFLGMFETHKKAFNPTLDQFFNMPFTAGLSDFYCENFDKSLKKSIKDEYSACNVRISNGMIRIPRDVFMRVFNPVVNDVTAHLRNLLKEEKLQNVSTILMVGGFSDCRVLQEAMKRDFSDRYTILVPQGAWSVVMKGAVLFGHRRDVIRSRISRKTYGTGVTLTFDESKHDPNKTEIIDNVKNAMDLFDIFVKCGQEVKLDMEVKKAYTPLYESQKAVSFCLYETYAVKPLYIDEKGVKKIGELTVDLPGEGKDRELELVMRFGGTEIELEARDVRHDGDVVTCSLDFLTK